MTKFDVPDLGQSAFSAYRADLPLGGREPSSEDDDAIVVADLLRQAALNARTPGGRRLLREATRIAQRTVGPALIERGCDLDSPGHPSPLDVFRILSERCTRNGQAYLADHLLVSVQQLAEPWSLVAGKALLRRTAVAWRLNELDFAQMQCEAVLREPRWRKYGELRLRAWFGLAFIASTRGEPDVAHRYHLRILRVVGVEDAAMKATVLHAVGIWHAKRGEFGKALEFAWQAYGLAGSVEPDRQMGFLSDMSQMLLDAGYPAAARAGFARSLASQSDTRYVHPLLGGYALASAALDDRVGVEWATRHVLQLAKLRGFHRQVADALIEVSTALTMVGQAARAGTMRRRAKRLAEQYGFRDIVLKAEPTALTPLPSRFVATDLVEEIVGHVADMEPDELPSVFAHAD